MIKRLLVLEDHGTFFQTDPASNKGVERPRPMDALRRHQL